MRALELVDGQLRFREDYPAPTAGSGSVIVRVTQAGICETDLQLVAGYMGFSGVPGHEFVGIAESGSFAGQRVVGEINCVCNNCNFCSRGLGNHCPHRTVIGIVNHDGAFADRLVVPEANLHRIPDRLSDDLATLVEPVAAALQIPEQIVLDKNMDAVVVGDGRLGNLCAQVLSKRVGSVRVVGKHAEKLRMFGGMDLETMLLPEVPANLAADIVADCTGSSSGLATALSLVRPRGTVVMKTTVAATHQLALAPVVIDEVTIVGSRCGPFDKAIKALAADEFSLEGFVSAHFPIDDFSTAFARAKEPDAIKVILQINSTD